MEQVTVIYHKNCNDGFCAAWLFKLAYPNATLIPSQYGEDPSELKLINTNVVIVDFSYDLITTKSIATVAKSLILLDHHLTSEETFRSIKEENLPHVHVYHNNNISGARLASDYLINNGMMSKIIKYYPTYKWGEDKSHWLVDYVEDRDMWFWKLPHSRYINSALRLYDLTLEEWDKLAARNKEELIEEGRIIQKYKNKLIEQHAKYTSITEISGYRASITRSTASDINSELAEYMLNKYTDCPIAIIVTETAEGQIYSLRSKTIDVSKIAVAHGGGGHKSAAGFKTKNYIADSIPNYLDINNLFDNQTTETAVDQTKPTYHGIDNI